MGTLKLRVKLSAYTKGILPTKTSDLANDSNYISDAPSDNDVYARKDNEWIKINESSSGSDVQVDNTLTRTEVDEDSIRLGLNQWVGTEPELPSILDEGKLYFVDDGNTPDLFINGGTSFSDGSNDYVDESQYKETYIGGSAVVGIYNLILTPLNSEGVSI